MTLSLSLSLSLKHTHTHTHTHTHRTYTPPPNTHTQSQKYWRCRYLLLPSSPPYLPPFCSVQERVQWENDRISDFVRFLEFLNHIKRGQVQGTGKTPLQQLQTHPSLVSPVTSWNEMLLHVYKSGIILVNQTETDINIEKLNCKCCLA